MIEIENEIFNAVATKLRETYEDIFVSGEYVPTPSSFPAVSIEEKDNYTYAQGIDSGGEKFVSVMYEVNVYSNKTVGKKSQAKEIMALIDDEMLTIGFTRTTKQPMAMPNQETNIYRLVARYRAIVGKDEQIIRR